MYQRIAYPSPDFFSPTFFPTLARPNNRRRGIGRGIGRGMGDDQGDYNFDQRFSAGATQGVNAGISTANQTGSVVAGSVAGGLALAAALDPEPFSKAALAIGAALTGIITKMAQGCGQTCVDASNYVNEAEPYFVENVANYANGPRTRSLQAQALANFDTAFNALVQTCQRIGGAGGMNCVKDRTAGSCKWKATPWRWNADGSYTPAGQAGSGSQCWNWVYGYRDPIAQDPFVQPDSILGSAGSAITDTINSLLGGTGVTGGSTALAGIPPWMLAAAVVALLVAVL